MGVANVKDQTFSHSDRDSFTQNPELQERQDRSIEMIQKWMQNSGDLTGDYEADNRRFAKVASALLSACLPPLRTHGKCR